MQEKIEELRKRRKETMLGGGADKLEKQHKEGKMTARERIDLMVDPNSFEEAGLFAEHRAVLFGMAGKSSPPRVVTGAAQFRAVLCILPARISAWPADPQARSIPSRLRKSWSSL
jgi:methylmalonyl-CoA carboxyltransferase large subunit